jgi:hypothetical protein
VSDNSVDTIGRTVTITNTTLSYGNPNALLRYSSLASLTVRGGSGGDTFNTLGTVAGATTTINGGAGNDTFQVGQNDVAGIQGPLVLDGGAGSNSVTVNDQGTSADKFYEIYADAVKRVLNPNSRTYDAVINYANVQTLTANGGRGENVFDVESDCGRHEHDRQRRFRHPKRLRSFRQQRRSRQPPRPSRDPRRTGTHQHPGLLRLLCDRRPDLHLDRQHGEPNGLGTRDL